MAEAQNFTIAVKNHTSMNFLPGEEKMEYGGVYRKNTIKKRTATSTVFYARGDRDAAAGTEGTLTYTSEDGTASITFKWDIPWGFGDDKLDVQAFGDIKLEQTSWRGDDVLRKVVEVIIYDDIPLL
ncbi:aegerolysin family protein [uncultured Kordia sp.]|uniref:aegerolysin family protein n=1 Tax=uncultured Kordia sp. TaxID=507699 RepID=UPI00262419D0|nr:aegerolysin family protein [uncultured Kordia sp.]